MNAAITTTGIVTPIAALSPVDKPEGLACPLLFVEEV